MNPKSDAAKARWTILNQMLSTIDKSQFTQRLGECGVESRPEHMVYWIYAKGVLWFIMHGSPDNDTEPGYADAWAMITTDGYPTKGFELWDSVPIAESPLDAIVPKRSKLRKLEEGD